MSMRIKVVLAVLCVVLGMGAVVVGGIAGVFWWHGRAVEELDEDGLRNYRPSQVTRILASDGQVIGEVYTQRRTLIDYDSIPTHVENAFLAAEDADFYRHEGMDLVGMARALVVNVKAGEIKQGASTITQQVVKIFILSPERTFERKVQELILARRLEQAFSKQEILELYLNEIYLGHGRYGIEEAARFYFGKSVSEINLGQAAVLAALPKAPSRDSPIKNPERAKERQTYVLRQMVKHGFATAAEAEAFIAAELPLAPAQERPAIAEGADEFVDAAHAELRSRYGDKLDTLGATVHTTVDLALQRQIRAELASGLVALDRRQGYGHKIKPASEARLRRAADKGAGPLSPGSIYPAVIAAPVTGMPPEGFVATIGVQSVFVRVPAGSRYDDPELSMSEQFVPGGITMVKLVAPAGEASKPIPAEYGEGEIGSGPEAAVVVTSVDTGEVLAMVGGQRYARGQFNRVTDAKRQPGSSFKPFVYGAAIASRKYTAASIVSDSPEIYEKWRPTNFIPDVYKGDIRLRVALTHSVNTIAIKLLDDVGFDAVHGFAQAAGIETALPSNLSMALGTTEVTPFELMTAYLTLARGGERVAPTVVRSIEAPGQPPWTFDPAPQRTLSQDVVFVLTSMMRSVVEEGTGRKARKLGRPVAGKTGTSAEHRDAWFAGFTTDRVAVAWVGFDQPKPIGKAETGGRAALPIWLAAMKAADPGGDDDFVPPPGVSVRRIDAGSGLLAPTGPDAEGAGKSLDEYFLDGTEPVEEAVPAALPAGDVLLDLYDDDGEDPDDDEPGTEVALDEPKPRPDPKTGPDGEDRLPSLDEF